VSSLIGNTYKRNLANIDVGGSQWPLLALVKCKKSVRLFSHSWRNRSPKNAPPRKESHTSLERHKLWHNWIFGWKTEL